MVVARDDESTAADTTPLRALACVRCVAHQSLQPLHHELGGCGGELIPTISKVQSYHVAGGGGGG
jgi:hypothetical protein